MLDLGDLISAGSIAAWLHREQERRSRLKEPVDRAVSQEVLANTISRKRNFMEAKQALLRNRMLARHTQGRAQTQAK